MTCNKINGLIYLYSYDELTDQERVTVKTHLDSCPECSAKLERFQQSGTHLYNAFHVPPTPDWDRSWQKIQQRLETGGSLQQGKVFLRQPTFLWAGALAASIAIFVLGVFIGIQIIPHSTPKPLAQTTDSSESKTLHKEREFFVQEFQNHLENIKPIILEYANYLKQTRSTDGKNMQMEKEMVIELLIRNQLLLCRLPSDNNRYMQQLLNELQDILTRIAAMTLDDPESMALIKNMIRQKGLIFKMEALRPQEKKAISL